MNVVLGIETSCDETAVAIVNDQRQVLAHCLQSQIAEHEPHGGVVPEIAARAHLHYLPNMITQTLGQANLSWQDITAIAATAGPGLIGGILVGAMTAKAIAAALQKPFIAVNHLEGHALTVRLTHAIEFPYLLLLVSGGHTQFLIVRDVGHYEFLGGTIDDAVGESFDKTAQLLGLEYPGGPLIEKIALAGDPKRFPFPRPLLGKASCDLSFSGLKTAVRIQVAKMPTLDAQDKADVAASFQEAIADCLNDRAARAFALALGVKQFVMAGGVAANAYLRQRLQKLCQVHEKDFIIPPA
ncbi:MAG: tRNA (adenosine(37)-N6)-threonylcarbamoyltransferase complex transferase subunit TsaD, partial [Alphaproteobacteria bacterium]